jgi:hypothetical protein
MCVHVFLPTPNLNRSRHTWKARGPNTWRKTRDLVPSLTTSSLPDIKEALQSSLLKLRLQESRRQPIEDDDFD